MSRETRRFIAIEGPIGVGKTTLATRLAETLGAQLLLERPADNPFLDRFYRAPREAALATQLHFLLQREQQLRELRQGDLFRQALVADFMIEKDRLFAEITLDRAEFALYEQVQRHLAIDPPRPDVVLYLQASAPVLLERIARRGRPAERAIRAEYLDALGERYARLFYDYTAAPVVIINTSHINPIANDADLALVLRAIERAEHGLHYLNAQSAAMERV
ncbi:MAG: deoxynucleoside kinase [Chromatiales bacterium]|nr:deoxynucleoside kinase [Chromatiales bacterium]